MSRVVRSSLNFVASSATSIVATLAAFVATPFVLHGLGAERLGAFRAATEWAGYLALLDAGLLAALAPLIARAAATGDRDSLRNVLAAGVRAYLHVALWTLLAGIVLWTFLPGLIRLPPELNGELRLGFAFAVAALVFIPLNVYRALAEALQKQYLVSALLCVQLIATTAGCVVAAEAGWGLPGQFGAAAAGTLILPFGLLLLFRGVAQPGALIAHAPGTGDEGRQLRKLNRTTLAYQLFGRLSLLSDNIIVGLFLGPAAVASFFLTTRLPQAAVGQVLAIGNATWAGLAELYHSGQHDIFRARLIQLTRFTAILGGALIVPLAVLTAPFVSLWIGPLHFAGSCVVLLAVFNGILLPIFSLWGWVFSGLGRIGLILPYAIAEGILSIGASLTATWWVGISGPLIGAALINLFYRPWWITRLLRREFAVSTRDLLLAATLPILPALLIVAGLDAGYAIAPAVSWTRLICEFGGSAALYFVVAWHAVLGDDERATFRRLFENMYANATRKLVVN